MNELAKNAKSWPFEEAKKLLDRISTKTPDKAYVLFQTGYGPSGLPHIGTFAEVARTTMVINAFKVLTDNKIPTKMICFSDDMDGFRKVPSNVPNKGELEKHLGKPLTKIPDPFGCCNSYGAHNNKQLCKFLDRFDFDYELISSTEYYLAGKFDKALEKVMDNYDKILNIMLPTLGEKRRLDYSPFLPICKKSGVVLQVKIQSINVDDKTLTYIDEAGREITTSILGGNCKLQWKPDWAMRWYALGVDYEMCGKDLKPSFDMSGKILKCLGHKEKKIYAPVNLVYELFLDKNGEKISKSKGNGLSIEEWLNYAPPQSLSLFMMQKPKTAKKLFLNLIPKVMDEYLNWLAKYQTDSEGEKLDNPSFHIHLGNVPKKTSPISFSLLLNLASAANADNTKILWGFIEPYLKKLDSSYDETLDKNILVDQMVEFAVRYYNNFIKPDKKYKVPNEVEKKYFEMLKTKLQNTDSSADASQIQSIVFSVGKDAGFENLREWFTLIYETLLGQSQGPRMGSFIALYGIDKTVNLIDDALNKET